MPAENTPGDELNRVFYETVQRCAREHGTVEEIPALELERFSFEVTPREAGRFEPFLLELAGDDEDRAARRAYFSAMSHLAGRGVDVDGFDVRCWRDNSPGPLVGPGGIGKGLELLDQAQELTPAERQALHYGDTSGEPLGR